MFLIVLFGILFVWGIIWAIKSGLRDWKRFFQQQEALKQTQKQIYQDEFLAIRTSVLKRDKYRCVNCRITGKELHVHNIIPRSEGGTNDLSNLVSLCSDCHGVHSQGHQLIQRN